MEHISLGGGGLNLIPVAFLAFGDFEKAFQKFGSRGVKSEIELPRATESVNERIAEVQEQIGESSPLSAEGDFFLDDKFNEKELYNFFVSLLVR